MAWEKWSVSEISHFQSRQTEMESSKVFSGGVLITWMLPRKKNSYKMCSDQRPRRGVA